VPTGLTRLAAAALAAASVVMPISGIAAGQEACRDGETRPTILPGQRPEIDATVRCPRDTPSQTPVKARGGGRGGRSNCTSAPFGPISQVEGIWRAINRGEQPEIDDPGDAERSYFVGPWYRITPGKIELRYLVTCVNPPSSEAIWVLVTPTRDGRLVPRVTPEDLIPGAYDRVQRMLPTPVPRIAPSDLAADGFAFVQTSTFFWVDQAPGQWEPVSATAAVGGLSLTVTAAPEQLIVSTGDGTTLDCAGAPPAFPTGTDPATFDGCEHVYRHSSAMASNGQTYPVTVAIVWHATWQASNGESGDLGTLTTTSATRDLQVAEIQAVVTQG
jgi:hypothetical protein